jgi:hypothetical protein
VYDESKVGFVESHPKRGRGNQGFDAVCQKSRFQFPNEVIPERAGGGSPFCFQWLLVSVQVISDIQPSLLIRTKGFNTRIQFTFCIIVKLKAES